MLSTKNATSLKWMKRKNSWTYFTAGINTVGAFVQTNTIMRTREFTFASAKRFIAAASAIPWAITGSRRGKTSFIPDENKKSGISTVHEYK